MGVNKIQAMIENDNTNDLIGKRIVKCYFNADTEMLNGNFYADLVIVTEDGKKHIINLKYIM